METDSTYNKKTESVQATQGATLPNPKGHSLSPLSASGKQRLIKYSLIALAVLVIGWVAKDIFHIGDKVYAQAAGHKIYKKDIQGLIGHQKGISYHNAAQVLADKYLYEAMAKNAGLTITDQDVKAEYPDINNQKTSDKYVYQDNLNNVYSDQLLAYNKGLYKGDALATNFSQNIAFQSQVLPIQQITNPLLGNKVAIAKDKKYAHDLIYKLYNQIKSGTLTFEQAISIEHKDPRVGEKAYPTEPHSGPFDTSNTDLPGTFLLIAPSIQPKLASMKAGQLSEPFAVRVSNSWKNPKITTETYYLVVRMDYTKGSHSGLSFPEYLAKAKKQYGYKINI